MFLFTTPNPTSGFTNGTKKDLIYLEAFEQVKFISR